MIGIHVLYFAVLWAGSMAIGINVMIYLRRVVGTRRSDVRDLVIILTLAVGATILTLL